MSSPGLVQSLMPQLYTVWSQMIHIELQGIHIVGCDVVEGNSVVADGLSSLKKMDEHVREKKNTDGYS